VLEHSAETLWIESYYRLPALRPYIVFFKVWYKTDLQRTKGHYIYNINALFNSHQSHNS